MFIWRLKKKASFINPNYPVTFKVISAQLDGKRQDDKKQGALMAVLT